MPIEPTNYAEVQLAEVTAASDAEIRWSGGYIAFGDSGAAQSATVFFAIPPGHRLGRHCDTAEETQLIVGGSGTLRLDDGDRPMRPGDVAVLPEGVFHDLVNTGEEDLRVVGFFSAPSVEQHWDEELADGGRVTGTPNRG
jgi:quercetin dioxygenase-like cupin family protein